MKERLVDGERAIVADHQSAEVTEPGHAAQNPQNTFQHLAVIAAWSPASGSVSDRRQEGPDLFPLHVGQ